MAHNLKPLIFIGRNGLDKPQFLAIEQALFDHELIKVKLGKSGPHSLEEMIKLVETGTRGTCIQSIGKTAVFYAPHPEEPKIVIPRPDKTGKVKKSEA